MTALSVKVSCLRRLVCDLEAVLFILLLFCVTFIPSRRYDSIPVDGPLRFYRPEKLKFLDHTIFCIEIYKIIV